MQSKAAKAARWLGYVPFEAIRDERNDPPIVHRVEPTFNSISAHVFPGYLWVPDLELPEVPSAELSVQPLAHADGWDKRQPYHLVLFGEKSSLEDVLEPIASRFTADLYVMTGEMSDTYIGRMARDNAQDGRPLRVFTVSDFDPDRQIT